MVENFKPHIGKNVLETLTMGMYDDSRFIFREYIQNAADQIDVAVEENILPNKDKGEINITIDQLNRIITIEDNATGIKSKSVLNFLGDVANSQKDSANRKGFRGIGRLGGLGYCSKLIFETSYKGESEKNVMTLNGDLLREIISDRKIDDDASAVLSIITSIENFPEESNKHYFKVILLDVSNNFLLNINNVTEYLKTVAPLPFAEEFSFKDKIIDFYKKNNFIFDEYNVKLNNAKLSKAYKNYFVVKDFNPNLIDVDFFKVFDEDELIGIGWFGFHDHTNHVFSSINIERGIRIKKGNITIGDENTLNRFFDDDKRTNLRLVGELHILSNKLVPNARRDYFNDNKTCKAFEKQLTAIFREENWENRIAQTTSNIHNRIKEIENYQKSKEIYDKNKDNFVNKEQEIKETNELEIAKQKALKASKTLSKISEKALQDKTVKKIFQSIVAEKNLIVDSNIEVPVLKYDPPKFSKLNETESEVVRDILKIIQESLPHDLSEKLKAKIIEKFN
ncbi:ATP-binding protein [Flavobacterium sp.]|uniref:ATP-binding protein n=1 Tax=Flavobacterium sp. TaxID=239 RepID=UPI004048A91B